MFRNYLIIALRNLKRQKTFSAINILGLAIGLATCILIVLYIQDELSFDSLACERRSDLSRDAGDQSRGAIELSARYVGRTGRGT